MKYSDNIEINQNFQSSINLDLDLNSEKKINEYIPTSDICDVLKKYVRTVLNYDQNHSTILAGPYGKGKSFLLLVLSYLLGKKEKNDTYFSLLSKIKTIDRELYELLVELDNKEMAFIPVVINSTYDNLNQSFMLALNDALMREGLTGIVPETTYSVCLNIIEKWEKDDSYLRKIKNECLKKGNTIEKIKRGLKEYNQDSYREFESLYNCVSMGLDFNPLVNNDIVKIYSDIIHELPKYGYSGLFVIFDEFSKFLESAGDELTKHLKMIQDFAEKANRSSKKEQINFCCVTHKSLELYSNKRKSDALKTVEGRFKEIRFNRSLSENYQIIAAAIHKTNGEALNGKIKEKTNLYHDISQSELFKDVTDFESVSHGCFPLNPVTVFALIHLSEIVAQNERTLFTFISDTDENSFNSFVQNNESGLFNVDKIYDYFSSLLKKEEENSIRNIWYRTEAVLSRMTDSIQRRIIKGLSIILMINETDVYFPNVDNLHISLDIEKDVIEENIKKLIDEHYLRRNALNNLLSFASANSKMIDEQIEVVSKTKLRNISFSDLLMEIDEIKYLLPRRYNANYKITRFYRNVYLTEDQFLNLRSFGVLKEKVFCDGLIINLITKKVSRKKIKEVVDEIGDHTVIVKYPHEHIESYFEEMLKRYAALKLIISSEKNDDVVTDELKLFQEETKEDIREMVDKYFDNESEYYAIDKKTSLNFTDLLSKIFEKTYSDTIIFNNELVNKNTVSVQYQKAINHVNDLLLSNSVDTIHEIYSETSPEMTVYMSIIKKIQADERARSVIDTIKERIARSETKSIFLEEIYKDFLHSPYGLRKGVIPSLLCFAISELSDNVILYLHKTEIELNATNIAKAVNSNSNYIIGFAKGSNEQNEFVYELMQCLNIERSGNFRQDIKSLSTGLRKFFVGLPLIIRGGNVKALNILDDITKYSKKFMAYDINPTDIVLKDTIEIFGSYTNALSNLNDFIQNWKMYLYDYSSLLVGNIKKALNIDDETSLKKGAEEFIKETVKNGTPILSDMDRSIMQCLSSLSYDDAESVDAISKTILGVYVDDWNSDRSEELISKLNTYMSNMATSGKINKDNASFDEIFDKLNAVENTQMGILLENEVESVFEEYGGAVSSEEKVAILSKMLKRLM